MQKIIKTSLVFGAISGVASTLWFFGVYILGYNPFYSFEQKLSMLLMGFFAFGAIYFYRKRVNQGNLSFSEGSLIGILHTLCAALICCIAIYVYVEYMNPQMVDEHVVELKKYLTANKQKLIEGSNAATYEGTLKAVNEVTAYTLALDAFIWKVVEGFMFSFLISIALRRSNKA